MRELASEYLTLARKQTAAAALMNGHRVVGISLILTGDVAEGCAHLDQAVALYEPAEHRSLTSLFGTDFAVSILGYRSLGFWLRGYPAAAMVDNDRALKNARDISQAASLMFALFHGSLVLQFGNYVAARTHTAELGALADEKDALLWKSLGIPVQGWLLALIGKASDATQAITTGITAMRSTGAALWTPLSLAYLTRAYAELGQFDDAWRCVGEAMTVIETTKERWCEAEVNRIAGEIALKSPEPDIAKTEAYFERALAVARQQHAKSWELRAATSMARLWRDQGKRDEAHDLLAPVYGWFTEGFDTRDLREAKALLAELAA